MKNLCWSEIPYVIVQADVKLSFLHILSNQENQHVPMDGAPSVTMHNLICN